MINLELFCCSGGMAMGFRRAGIEFDIAVDFERDHCDSYERNLGHRPEQLDVRVLLEQVRIGARHLDVDLLVADPPCTPWSRAGKRLGTRDERDMLKVTCDLIAALRPRRYMIGNVHVLLAPESGRQKRPASTRGPQSARTISPDAPSSTVQAREDRIGSGSPVLEWPWQRPATTITNRPGLAPPGHHDEAFSIMSLPDAVILSERAAAILQGFPDDGSWTFCGKTKKARWSQLGQAMPIALAEAVARSIVWQVYETERLNAEQERRDQAELTLVAG